MISCAEVFTTWTTSNVLTGYIHDGFEKLGISEVLGSGGSDGVDEERDGEADEKSIVVPKL